MGWGDVLLQSLRCMKAGWEGYASWCSGGHGVQLYGQVENLRRVGILQ